MKPYNKYDAQSILKYAKQLEDNSLRSACPDKCQKLNINKKNKGKLGELVETLYFEYPNNTKAEADFYEAGVELKVTPLYKTKNHLLKPKERLVLESINFMTIVNETWHSNSLLKKLRQLLLMFYLHENNKEVVDLVFKLISLWSPSEEDWKIIRKDWELITNKIKSGKAHEISEGDTRYLGACVKGACANTVQKQPYSDVPAKKRAFSLKHSYMNAIFEILSAQKESQKLSEDGNFEKIIIDKFMSLIGKSLENIIQENGIFRQRKAKNFLNLIMLDYIKSVFGQKLEEFEEFKKSGIEVKTILLKHNGKPKEAMSFPTIDYIELITQDWDESDIKEKFENEKHLWLVFETNKTYTKQSDLSLSDIYFIKAMFWNMPELDLENYVYKAWLDTVQKVKNGDYNHFIKASENLVCHVRPHARNSSDLTLTPQGTMEKKMCFWLNTEYIKEQIKKTD